ncbi:hypothetical protein [Geotalea sp. SG265]|uniref:hypothetical protein n=1 Tax=Geotalea sp. SG265 TaxID=2922867 RepID=UPI001FB04809|nr:hypothetical protein [Geotalea sp. SG265]
MSEVPQTSGERHIEKIMEQLDPQSERYQVLDTAKRFKSSWVELGDKLLQVSSRGHFREWGYQSFEDYCVHEIRIKKGTAEKLTLAYRYMEKQEPELLAQHNPLKPLPDFRSVDLLRQAREEKGFSEDEYAQLRKSVVEEERSHPTVLKRFKEVAAAHQPEEPDPIMPVKASLSAARRLDTSLQGVPQVPAELRDNVVNLILHLEEVLQALVPPAASGTDAAS